MTLCTLSVTSLINEFALEVLDKNDRDHPRNATLATRTPTTACGGTPHDTNDVGPARAPSIMRWDVMRESVRHYSDGDLRMIAQAVYAEQEARRWQSEEGPTHPSQGLADVTYAGGAE